MTSSWHTKMCTRLHSIEFWCGLIPIKFTTSQSQQIFRLKTVICNVSSTTSIQCDKSKPSLKTWHLWNKTSLRNLCSWLTLVRKKGFNRQQYLTQCSYSRRQPCYDMNHFWHFDTHVYVQWLECHAGNHSLLNHNGRLDGLRLSTSAKRIFGNIIRALTELLIYQSVGLLLMQIYGYHRCMSTNWFIVPWRFGVTFWITNFQTYIEHRCLEHFLWKLP